MLEDVLLKPTKFIDMVKTASAAATLLKTTWLTKI
jgi:hypothetical protein